MSPARRILVTGGIALAIWGMAYGLCYAVFAEHQALDQIGSSLARGFSAAAQRHPQEVSVALGGYRQTKFAYDRQVDVHGHWIGLAMVLIVLGIGLDRLPFSERVKTVVSSGALLGSVLFPLGVLLQTIDHGPGPRVVAIAGSALVIAALAAFALGFLRQRSA